MLPGLWLKILSLLHWLFILFKLWVGIEKGEIFPDFCTHYPSTYIVNFNEIKTYVCIVSDAEGTAGADLQRKLDLLNGTLALDAERAEQARRQMQYIAHCKYKSL